MTDRPAGEQRAGAVSLVLACLVVVGFIVSLGIGSVYIPPSDVIAALFGGSDLSTRIIVIEIRLPRALLAVILGAALGLSGAALQGLLRNPLAAPSLFGAPASAAFGAVATISLGLAGPVSYVLPVAAIAGAFVSVALLLLVAGPRASLLTLILAGLAISSLAGAGTALALNLAPNPFAALEIAFWLLGSLEDRSFRHVGIAAPFVAAGCVLLVWDSRAFRALSLGEETARSLGFNLGRVRLRVVAGVAMAVGAGVAVAGSIGFIGLMAPHMVRHAVGHDPVRVMRPAAFAGAALLLFADTLVRLVPTQSQIKVGVVTALLGAPFFILLVLRRRRGDAGG